MNEFTTKELTIEEKAQRYDKALDNARYYHKEMGNDRDDIKCILEECFPQLQESEDDIIREQILDYFVAKKVNEPQPVLDSWIAWLEKQGKEKSSWTEEDIDHVESILKRLEGMCKEGATFTQTRFAVSEDIDWLNFLKDRHIDNFIEKACQWIKENITNNPNSNSVLVRNGFVTLRMLIDDFKRYMKRK